jgi:hypothetical protein
MAATIPNAHVVGLDGRDVAPFVGDEVVTEVERFLRAPRDRGHGALGRNGWLTSSQEGVGRRIGLRERSRVVAAKGEFHHSAHSRAPYHRRVNPRTRGLCCGTSLIARGSRG